MKHIRFLPVWPAMIWAALMALALPAPAAPPTRPAPQALPAPGQTLRITGRANQVGGGLSVRLPEAKPRSATLTVIAQDMVEANQHYHTSKLPKGLKDALLQVRWSGPPQRVDRLLFIRPDAHFYDGEDLKRALSRWDTLPPASAHVFTLELTGLGDAVEISIDGRFLARLPRQEVGGTLQVQPIKEGQALEIQTVASGRTGQYLPIDLRGQASPGEVKLSGPVLSEQGKAAVAAAHLPPVEGDHYVDVGLSRWLWQDKGPKGFYDPYDKRSAWDGMPERIIFDIPPAAYVRAHVLCVLRDEDGRKPAMTVRLARNNIAWNGAGATYGDTAVDLDPKALQGAADLRQVGTVQLQRNGRAQTLPLYLATIPLHSGELAGGMISGEPVYEDKESFSLELSRVMGQIHTSSHGNFGLRPVGPQSGIVVLGLSLERPAVQLLVRSAQRDLVFYRDQKAALEVVAHNPTAQKQTIEMKADLVDYEGQHQSMSQTLEVAPGDSVHRIPLDELEYGWHEGHFTFQDSAGQRLWSQRVAFALLPLETRQASYQQSPFSVWWFNGSHRTQADPDIALPLVRKLGFRRVTPHYDPKKGQTPDKYRQYGVFPAMMGYLRGEDMAKVEERAKTFHADFPEVTWAMIFHETGGTGEPLSLPPELLGQKYPPREAKAQARFESLEKLARNYVQTVRKVAPDMKFILGNGTTNFNIAWLRAGFPRSSFDALGMEMAVQLFHPESQPTGWNLQSYWIGKRMKQVYGYKDLPMTDCYEVDYRATADGALSRRRQADWYARDVLLGLAYRLPVIAVGLLDDCNDSYYFSRWGSAGVMERAPMMMPKPSYVSLSTLTRVLDRAQYQRWLPTGSTVGHCLEFKGPQGYVYALWTSRGRRQARLKFEQPAHDLKWVHSAGYGRDQDPARPLTISGTPCYLLSPVRLSSVALEAPARTPAALENAQVIGQPRPDRWRIVPGETLEQWDAYEPLQRGEALLSGDAGSLKITLSPRTDLPDLVSQYVALEPVDGPLAISGEPDAVGAWVHGNGNWGRVIFELIDAKGRHWISEGKGAGPTGWGMADWMGDASINFDGWRLVTQPLPLTYPSGYPGLHQCDWNVQGGHAEPMAFPIRLSRVYLTFRQRLVHVTDMVNAASLSIDLGEIVAGRSGQALRLEPFARSAGEKAPIGRSAP